MNTTSLKHMLCEENGWRLDETEVKFLGIDAYADGRIYKYNVSNKHLDNDKTVKITILHNWNK